MPEQSGWVDAGPFQVWIARGHVHPEHENQSVGIRPLREGRGRDREFDARETLLCSRAQWAEFVKAIKEGRVNA